MKRLIAILLSLLLLAGCTPPSQGEMPFLQPNDTQDGTGQSQPVSTQIDVESLFSNRDKDPSYDESKSAVLTLSGDSISCGSNAVKISGATATITDEGTYILRGSLKNGQIVVDTDKENKVQVVLDGANITCSSGAALHIKQADKVFITLAAGKENILASTGFSDGDSNVDGAVFSKEDITFNGSGSLIVNSSAGHGIVSKDELTVTGGQLNITCTGHGLAGKDSVAILDAAMILSTGKDGIHAENNDDTALGYLYIGGGSFQITAAGDGISAANAMQLDGGSYTITTGGGSVNGQQHTSGGWGGMGGRPGGGGDRPGRPGETTTSSTTEEDSTSIKGIKASGDLVINGGSYQINAADDGVHSNSNLTVTAGTFGIATGDDGFHADDTLTITAGAVTITESYEGLEGLHIKVSGGDITLTASDDGINAAGGADQSGFGGIRGDQFGGRGHGGGMSSGNGSIVISGGKLDVTASGDGIDANGTLEITGGHTTVTGPTRGDTATLDYDKTATISGGTFIGTGAAGMAQTFSQSEQGVLSVRVAGYAAGTKLTLTDESGKVILEHTPQLDYMVVIISTPEIQKGANYTLTIDNIPLTYTAN